jgi:hypothetical protein
MNQARLCGKLRRNVTKWLDYQVVSPFFQVNLASTFGTIVERIGAELSSLQIPIFSVRFPSF